MKPATIVGLCGLASSLVALALAPIVLDPSYSWLKHTTSESGGQGVDGAWLARAGFFLFGLAVIWIAFHARDHWRQPAVALHLTFAICMLGVGVFSLRSWLPDTSFDATEDLLHSVGATVMGFAFAFGVVAVAIRLRRGGGKWRVFDAVAVIASVVLPIGMSINGNIDGALQRLMFLIAYVWYAREAIATASAVESQSEEAKAISTD